VEDCRPNWSATSNRQRLRTTLPDVSEVTLIRVFLTLLVDARNMVNQKLMLVDQFFANPHEGPDAQDQSVSQYNSEMVDDSLRRKLIPGRDLK
jgi:hypothetical protein